MSENTIYDVIILGGAFSGSASSYMLHQFNPDLKIAIIEKSGKFKRRVGESTVEVSSWFLLRALHLGEHLNQEHINKQGLRFWFDNEKCSRFTECSEVGPKYNVRLPGFQIDRSILDEHLLSKASKKGATVYRKWKVSNIEQQPDSTSNVHILSLDSIDRLTLKAKWVIDATGMNAYVARKNNWFTSNDKHKTSALWARFKNVKQLDSDTDCNNDFNWRNKAFGMRMPATNHVTGFGWWSWWIPLKGGDYSIGVVYDNSILEVKEANTSNAESLLNFLKTNHTFSHFMLDEAEIVQNDVSFRKNLPYQSEYISKKGICLVGDAAGFIDPFYSPGLDWCAFTVMNGVKLINNDLDKGLKQRDFNKNNKTFKRCYKRWFEALYQDKYYYMGDAELMNLAFKLDLGTYYLGVVDPVYKKGLSGMNHPPFTRPFSSPAFYIIRCYNRRLSKMAIARKIRNKWGVKNNNMYFPFNSYTLDNWSKLRLFKYFGEWFKLEIKEGWRTWFKRKSKLLKSLEANQLKQP